MRRDFLFLNLDSWILDSEGLPAKHAKGREKGSGVADFL